MNDLELLRELAEQTPLPPLTQLGPARARLTAAIAAAPAIDGPAPAGPRPVRPLRWLGRPRLVMGIAVAAAAAAAAALVAVSLPGTTPPGPHSVRPGPASPGAVPSAASLGHAMLTAAGAVNDDILYTTETGISKGVVTSIYQDWSWPAQPVPGQPERYRNAFTEAVPRTAPLKLIENDGFSYVTPPAAALNVYGELTVVCYAGTSQTGCGYGSTETPAGTWSQQHGRFLNPNPGLADLSPAALARGIVRGLWRVAGHARVDGQPAIKLTETPAGEYQPLPTWLWVSARTHLPLRMINGSGQPVVTQIDWHYLKPTTANLRLLQVPVPPGYPRVTPTKG